MNFLIGLMIFVTLILGANFCMLLIGGFPWKKGEEFAPIHLGQRTYTVERFSVGVSTSVLGVSWLVAWTFFMTTRWDAFISQFQSLWFHVFLQLVASIGLIVAGIAIFRQWKRNKGIFLSSIGVLVGSIFIAILVYGARGHGNPMFMYLIGAWTLVVGGVFTTAVYLLDRLLNQENQPQLMQKGHQPRPAEARNGYSH